HRPLRLAREDAHPRGLPPARGRGVQALRRRPPRQGVSGTPAADPVDAGSAAPGGNLGLPRPREVLGTAILLGALLVGFFARAIGPGRVLSAADILLLFSPWRHDVPAGFQAANTLLIDYVLQFRPWRTFAVAALRSGTVPLWDPHNYAGAPLVANG